jgi:hypothetical protein
MFKELEGELDALKRQQNDDFQRMKEVVGELRTILADKASTEHVDMTYATKDMVAQVRLAL